MTQKKTNCDCLRHMSVKRPLGWSLANESYDRVQTFCRQSKGYARLGLMSLYFNISKECFQHIFTFLFLQFNCNIVHRRPTKKKVT